MTLLRKYLAAAGMLFCPLAVATGPCLVMGTTVAQASEIAVIVNNIPITSADIKHRAAFLKLQHKSPAEAKQDMIDQTLRSIEMQRLHVNVPDKEVDGAYANFAKKNKLSTAQLDRILAQTGVTEDHFKQFIRVQMGWGQALGARSRAEGGSSAQAAVEKMLQNGGKKPTAIEYTLQQVIFVVPTRDRSAILGKRKREAESLRARFAGCDKTREFAKGLIDVTVRDLGRVLGPELPPDWADFIKETKSGSPTKVRETPRGVEFIAICSEREVSDDRVAELTFQKEGDQNKEADALSKKYTAELKDKAVIINR